jgi:hypothetical protein
MRTDSSIWTIQLDEITNQFREEFELLTVNELNWIPSPEVWSIAQCIDHLIVINRSYFPTFQALSNGTYKQAFISRLPFMVNALGKALLSGVQPDRRRKMKTFPIWQPTAGKYDKKVLEEFEKMQGELKAWMERSVPWLENQVVISSPANRNVVYKLETAFDIIVAHERRHLEQALEMKSLLPKI